MWSSDGWILIAVILLFALLVVAAWVCATIGAHLDRVRWGLERSFAIRFRVMTVVSIFIVASIMTAGVTVLSVNRKGGSFLGSDGMTADEAEHWYYLHFPQASRAQSILWQHTAAPGCSRFVIWQDPVPTGVMPGLVEVKRIGWPLHCIDWSPRPSVLQAGGPHWRLGWQGSLANVAAFALPAWVVVLIASNARRLRRVLKWRCPKCGYAVSTMQTCSECGNDLSLLIRSDSRLN
jgi:hypothetical protein